MQLASENGKGGARVGQKKHERGGENASSDLVNQSVILNNHQDPSLCIVCGFFLFFFPFFWFLEAPLSPFPPPK
jgi:hypothetical protein